MNKQIAGKPVMDLKALQNVIIFATSSAREVAEKNKIILDIADGKNLSIETSGLYSHSTYSGACSMDLMRNPEKIIAMLEKTYVKEAAPNKVFNAYD